ncbi:MAG: hypothetical protein JJ895_12005 [Balneolaceae bacterium]|nr:hypothetical protein [Balneolaceae bacterium]
MLPRYFATAIPQRFSPALFHHPTIPFTKTSTKSRIFWMMRDPISWALSRLGRDSMHAITSSGVVEWSSEKLS